MLDSPLCSSTSVKLKSTVLYPASTGRTGLAARGGQLLAIVSQSSTAVCRADKFSQVSQVRCNNLYLSAKHYSPCSPTGFWKFLRSSNFFYSIFLPHMGKNWIRTYFSIPLMLYAIVGRKAKQNSARTFQPIHLQKYFGPSIMLYIISIWLSPLVTFAVVS